VFPVKDVRKEKQEIGSPSCTGDTDIQMRLK
jgi:hypothetical protein